MISSTCRAGDGLDLAVRTTVPSVPARGIVQIVHGMAEHAARYDALAARLAQAGFVVVAHDQRGHGDTSAGTLGHIADEHGWRLLVEDAARVGAQVRALYPGLPLVVLGHSMGSVVARTLVQEHPTAADALVLSGTVADPGTAKRVAASLTARIIARVGGPARPSRLLDRLLNGPFNRPFRPARTPFDWLSRDEDQVDAYIADPRCGFVCSAQFYVDLLTGLSLARKRSRTSAVRRTMPIHIIGGDEDPVGDDGVAVSALSADYRRVGLREVTTRLYRGARHELFNETCADEVVTDLVDWLDRHVPRVAAGNVVPLRRRGRARS